MLAILRKRLAELLEQRKTAATARDQILVAPQAENRDLTDDEKTTFGERRAAVAKIDTELEDLRVRITDLEADEKREQAAAQMLADSGQTGQARSGGAVITSEPTTYGRGSRGSYFLDLARAQLKNEPDAWERLKRHGREIDVDLPKRAKDREDGKRELGASFEKRTNPNRTDGTGGYFVPPLWLMDEYVPYLRAGRPFANSLRTMDLPPGTDSINVPKVATGTATGVQTADAATITSTDLTDTTISAPVKTIAGQQDIAMQLLDQSPVGFDSIVYADLLADYNMQLDRQAIYGTGSSGQLTGVTQVSSIVAVTYTDGSPTAPEMYPAFAQAVSQISTNRFLPPTAYFMHPRRWYWLAAQLDSSNRPFITPMQAQEFNPMALQTGVSAEGPVGILLGLPVLIDANIPTTLGGGTEDQALAVRTSDIYLWEGSLQTRTLTEVLSGTMQVRIQVYAYVALMAGRYPKAIATMGGTGFAAPSGY